MIVDCAVHYIEPETVDRPHAAGGSDSPILLVEDAIADAKAAGIDAIVQMAPSRLGWDNRYSLEGPAKYPRDVLGVFGRFDPTLPGVAERLRAFAAQPGILGVRFLFRKDGPSRTWLEDRALDPFLDAAQEQGVAVSMHPADPVALLDTARRFPGMRFIAEHMTLTTPKPPGDGYARWRDVITVAAEPNVWMQVSYLPEGAPRSERPPYPTSQARFKELYEAVGASRMIWGAHYPRIREWCTYREALDTIRTATAAFAPSERDGVLGENFVRDFARGTSTRN